MTKETTFSASTGIHQGDRESQQDRVCIFRNTRESNCVLAIVADGMGGLSGGRKAADQVMLTADQLFKQFNSKTDDPRRLLEQIAQETHLVIGLTAMSSAEQPHSTFASFLITSAGTCYWAHVGDSRIYHFNKSQLMKRSTDHSYVQSLVDSCEITAEQAINHPQSNVLTRCLGSKNIPIVEHHYISNLREGDVIMACSDGVWPYFDTGELGSILGKLNPRESAELIITTARDRSHQRGDNLSIAIVKYA
ncbi:MAG: protein phosphatase 2C domain-containing protein [Cellvibrio sp.]|uniref:PP2C family protein-serine/threonine phosphatase n=1 Tax=Cellvibrio sp. TaxID=1965322 RepID=UPI002715BEB2|nr:protein phosphatase 2C domain-containing protein [Cellvibrio sp.]